MGQQEWRPQYEWYSLWLFLYRDHVAIFCETAHRRQRFADSHVFCADSRQESADSRQKTAHSIEQSL